jgi:hypothetical protein
VSATAPAPGTQEYTERQRAARVRAREELKRVEAQADRVTRQFATVAAAHFQGRVTDAELEAAEKVYEDALRARTRACAAAQGFGVGELLPRFGPL